MLEIKDFEKYYGSFHALSIPALSIPAGLHWVKGINGSGKTSLFKSISGLIPFSGDILLDGISIKKQAKAYRLKVNFSEAEPIFPSFLTGKELVSLYALAKKAPENQQIEILERLGAIEYYQQPVGSYSTGMLKKISIALAFIGNPSLIILDEPLIGLDVNAVMAVKEMIVDKKGKDKTSFLISSHQALDEQGIAYDRSYLVENRSLKSL